MLFRAILLSRISISLVHRIEIIKIEKKKQKNYHFFFKNSVNKKNKKICGKHAAASFTAAPDFLFCRYCELKNKQTNCAFQPRCKTIILLIIFCYDFFSYLSLPICLHFLLGFFTQMEVLRVYTTKNFQRLLIFKLVISLHNLIKSNFHEILNWM